MPNQFSTKKFKDLQDTWYKKLKASGFEDIESDENNLKEWDSSIFRRYSIHTADSKQEYYTLAGHFLHSHRFKNKKEQVIWEFHAQGNSLREISEKLRSKNYKVSSMSSIYTIVQSLVKEMLKK